MYPSFVSASSSLLLLTLLPCWALASLNPNELRNQVHSLGTETFGIKDMVLVMNDHPEHEIGRLTDVCSGLESLSQKILANIACTVGSTAIVNAKEQQLVFEGLSFFVQGLLELMDALSEMGADKAHMPPHDGKKHKEKEQGDGKKKKEKEEERPREPRCNVLSEVHALSGVLDAHLFMMIGLFPPASSFHFQANIQKGQVDTGVRHVVHTFHGLPDRMPEDGKKGREREREGEEGREREREGEEGREREREGEEDREREREGEEDREREREGEERRERERDGELDEKQKALSE